MTSVVRDLEVTYLCHFNEHSWYHSMNAVVVLTFLLTSHDVTIRGGGEFVRG